ncbi:hypothetical protein Lnau_0654 [Legionella nautarum]|uniref:Secreted protein n=1 Tax=Legionella nautarum TaxID=45070 RepID=A0A0W0WYW0_9GAMM|nr:hypothetical protein [Legionella nautarum]KTD37464.1 hypothetical protein Lnau_0654 [Legionella nautarum]
MKKHLFALLFLSSISGQALSAAPINLEGNYECVGRDKQHPDTVFKGEMTIKKTGETYSINSSFNDGGSYIGTGIYDKTKKTVSLVFTNPKDAKETGILVMDIKANGSMSNHWTYLNMKTIGQSTCTAR